MGVQHLWTILAPVKTHCPLESLQGKTLAVDLSMWVCEASAVKAMTGAVTKPHLRNLFFRVSHLTKMGISLIFVVDGDPPELKFQTMMKRNQDRFGGSKASTDGQKKGLGKPRKMKRSHFKAVLKECILLLDGLGIPHVQSKGEAEAFCALLNRENLVDGCLTDDGDAFLYGARTVYRNLTLDKKDPHVDCYMMADIEEELLLDRNKLVGLGLLLGCDYCPKGVPGVGKELAFKVMTALGTCDVLERFKVWRSEASDQTEAQCGTASQPKGSQKRAKNSSIEATVMRKSLTDPEFPDTKIIKEFLVTKDTCPSRKLEWKRPRLPALQELNLRLLEWPEEYTLEKVLPLVTYWEMSHIRTPDQKENSRPSLSPYSVVKTRTRNGVPCLEVQWYKPDGITAEGSYVTTIETEDLFTSAFPHLVQEFRERKASKQSRKKGGKTKAKQKCTDGMADTDSRQQGDTQPEEQANRPSAHSVVDNSLALDFSKLSLDKCNFKTSTLDEGKSAASTTRDCKEDNLPGKLNKDSATSQFAVSSEKVVPFYPPSFSKMNPNFSLGINDFSFMLNTDGDTSITTNTCRSSSTTEQDAMSKMGPDLEGQSNIQSPVSTHVMLPLMERLQLKGGKRRLPKAEKRSCYKDVPQSQPLKTDHRTAVQEKSNQDSLDKLKQKDRRGGQIIEAIGSFEHAFKSTEEQSVKTQRITPALTLSKATEGSVELLRPDAGKTKEVKGKGLHSSKIIDTLKKKTLEADEHLVKTQRITPVPKKATDGPVELLRPVADKSKQVKEKGILSSKSTDNLKKKTTLQADQQLVDTQRIPPVLSKATGDTVELPQPDAGKTQQVKERGLPSSKSTDNLKKKTTLQAGSETDSVELRKALMYSPASIHSSYTTDSSVLDDTKDVSGACTPCVVAKAKPTSACSTSTQMADVDSPGVTRMCLAERLRLRVGYSKGKVLDAMQGKH
ncbi:GEN1 [Branchiostoma lanceolatum]|uniref:Flap endonuclease GEN homolog 1 n=1 Tax=Branchiostoma lanceolatum TaxID=7740 RepID=A0A8J9Z0H5_BRALA|nr:GEN1 [Branchiostoma lanceolatum]